MTRTPALVPKPRRSNGLAPVLAWGVIFDYFSGECVDVDERNRPKSIPKLPKWATPEGWRQGFRHQQVTATIPASAPDTPGRSQNQETGQDVASLVCQIEALEEPLGKGIYRGLLKTVARVWRPIQIQDVALLQRVLVHMQAAERGLRRLHAALDVTGLRALAPILESLKLSSLDRMDNLETLKQIVLKLEQAAAEVKR